MDEIQEDTKRLMYQILKAKYYQYLFSAKDPLQPRSLEGQKSYSSKYVLRPQTAKSCYSINCSHQLKKLQMAPPPKSYRGLDLQRYIPRKNRSGDLLTQNIDYLYEEFDTKNWLRNS